MWQKLKDAVKAAVRWVFKWMTVIAALVFAGISTALDQLDQIAGIDFSAFMSPTRAAQLVAVVGVLKVLAVIAIATAKRRAP